ncbi:MAG: addiction module protein [Betaproteobacteria bacterium]|nr:addiction module protein [Betaproteobacteria bacterium]
MALSPQQILHEALKLTPQDRAMLADSLIASVDPSPAAAQAWEQEVAKRAGEIDRGEVALTSLDDAIVEMRTK